MAGKSNSSSKGVSWAEAARDVLIASMNKGQLPVLAVSACVFLMIFRMPSGDVSTLANEIVARLVDWTLVGWGMTLVIAFCWWFQAKQARTEYTAELARIGEQKSRAQDVAAGQKFPGSRGSGKR